ncbi:hypothetical protein DSECCO2_656930 [anaerobic digester metagenome]
MAVFVPRHPAVGPQHVPDGPHQGRLGPQVVLAAETLGELAQGFAHVRSVADQFRELRRGLGPAAHILSQTPDQIKAQVEHGVGEHAVTGRTSGMDLAGVDQAGLALPHGGVVPARTQALARPAVHQSHGVEVVVKMPREDVRAARRPADLDAGHAGDEFERGGVHGRDQ